jgi:hypothetical protein
MYTYMDVDNTGVVTVTGAKCMNIYVYIFIYMFMYRNKYLYIPFLVFQYDDYQGPWQVPRPLLHALPVMHLCKYNLISKNMSYSLHRYISNLSKYS